ncbi:protein PHLOEM UNLOADING MODULATOR [Physcomitrium patens]|uniref:Sphingomyelin synthase-like domain-containing protein n=1 Tax=Physcomitrium patens TaxID=3218 RepID=A9S9I4_PHYPA|nr:uncharacterized protein LOC112287586 [Physcomitrium patens]XP_024386488.1 uncharacterized protein LOC112287586 [Physcomitrium patens]XP_024386489.1 uncharacterized protein LOC112287586 [Physcomitrium patens]PNR46519.1 hypothetical protein PHYPA_013638 [Physcomitrium patens]|eukprot:XP_024386487.1 uncharacterized protein LOC112287586 [Physcomitrella patens]
MASYPKALGVAAVAYVAVDYLREVAPGLHQVLQPCLWGFFAVAAAVRAPYYDYWTREFRSIGIFLASLVFMLSCLCVEAMAVQYVTTVLGLDWHWSTAPLPDSGQWLVLAGNEKLPAAIVAFLRAPVIGLHHFLMLFLLLAFSVLYGCVKAPGMGLGARYMFTMGVGRLIRVLTFVATILPSARPWCAHARFKTANYPHPWAQKYYMPYAKDPNMVRQVIDRDEAFAAVGSYPPEYVPNWGSMQFLVNILRPMDPAKIGKGPENWFNTLKRAGGGCNDLVFSGHMYVAVLTAMAWQEAYPGWGSVFIWFLVAHTGQREIRERHHYSVDVVSGIYVGILMWRTTRWIWSSKDHNQKLKLKHLAAMEDDLQKAAKEGDLEGIRSMLNRVSKSGAEEKASERTLLLVAGSILFMTLGLGLLAFKLTADG